MISDSPEPPLRLVNCIQVTIAPQSRVGPCFFYFFFVSNEIEQIYDTTCFPIISISFNIYLSLQNFILKIFIEIFAWIKPFLLLAVLVLLLTRAKLLERIFCLFLSLEKHFITINMANTLAFYFDLIFETESNISIY